MRAAAAQTGSFAVPARRTSTGFTAALLRKPVAIAALVVLIVLVVAAIAAPLIAPYDPIVQDTAATRQGPSWVHLLGTDSLGRDLLSRLIWGGRDSLGGVALAVAVMLVIALPVGITTAYAGGRVDRVIMSIIDIVMSVPTIIITFAALAIFANSMTAAMITVGVLASAAFARIFRSAVLATRKELFVSAATVTGLRPFQILTRHVLPHATGVVLVQTSLFAAATLGIQTGLSFLAFGPPPPAPTWGGMVADASKVLATHPWMFVPTGGVIAVATLALGLLGDGIRDANAERFTAPIRTRDLFQKPAAVDSVVPTVASPLLSVRDLSIGFGEHSGLTVVDAVSFDIAPGEIVGLVGESGSGKTVTALAVLGLLGGTGRITRGSITFDGLELVGDLRALAATRGSGIGYVSQEPITSLDPTFRVGSQLIEAVRHHDRCSRAVARRRALELLAAVKIREPERVLRSYPHEISGGMAQRVIIARALAGRPRLLIADEPTTALDVTVQAEVLTLLRTVQQETGMAILLVTHDWGVVAETCSRALVMYAGQIVESAGVDDLLDRPRHPYTRALLASNPHGARRGETLPTIGGTVPSPADWPVGCRFAARCPLAVDECRAAPIPLIEAGPARTSRCIRIDALITDTAGGRP
ncbi:MAG: dipeptide/oligopeptide/nickel ABC transporter permease/ATP-binding protein [Pseudolysinimonas sp.]|uniref:dipeptide/oligopeptide/nickel ABC transporter permease/ATP-binding protein n=1 Tax=Pseudolysinimonas sp. TaxID=2680009 RepID=UPI0032632DCA